ncbi:hypothetical protein [Emcibacter sp. SYSU 3D8]|uniref:hypothetical protein n=1 Tax=Emcibacter sp. SYSU 3D8 TaxID=3133969 RepID=UPI0031FF2128
MKPTMKFALPLLAVVMLAGCGQDAAETAAEKIAKQHGIDMDIDSDGDESTVSMTGPDGSKVMVGQDLGLPSGFPDDVAMYPDIKIVSTSTTPQGFMIHAQSTDSLDKVVAFYEDRMTSKGWTRDAAQVQADTMQTMGFTKDDRRASVTVFAGDDTTTVQVATMDGV